MTNPTSFLRAISLAILAAAPLAGLQAQSVAALTQTLDFRLNANSDVWSNPDPNGSDGETTTLNFTPFDPSLGTLQSVSLNFTATERYVLGAYQTGGSTMNHHSLQIDNTGAFMIDNQSFQLPATPRLTGISPGVVNLATANSSLAAGFTTFLAGGTPTFPGGVTLAGNESINGSSSLPLDLTDLSPIYIVGTSTISETGGNNDAQEMTDLFGSVTMTYDYTPIPEPATYATLAGLVTLAMAIARRRRTGCEADRA